MRKHVLSFLIAAVLCVAGTAAAATDLFTSAGTLVTATSSCPTAAAASCSSGWFSITGAFKAAVHVWETTGSGTATVVLEQRFDSTDGTVTLKTWTNPTATEIGLAIDPPVGEIRIRVTAIGSSGLIKAKLTAVRFDGTRLW